MSSDEDSPSRDAELDAKMAEFLADVSGEPLPPRLKDLAEQLKKALQKARNT